MLTLAEDAESPAVQASEILKATSVTGGLVVHLGCGDGRLTAALRASDAYLVHGLDANAANVERARAHVRSLGLYGKVSIDHLADHRLPYADNTVNLVVRDARGGIRDAGFEIRDDEIMRVLAPGGVALALDSRLSTLDSELLL